MPLAGQRKDHLKQVGPRKLPNKAKLSGDDAQSECVVLFEHDANVTSARSARLKPAAEINVETSPQFLCHPFVLCDKSILRSRRLYPE